MNNVNHRKPMLASHIVFAVGERQFSSINNGPEQPTLFLFSFVCSCFLGFFEVKRPFLDMEHLEATIVILVTGLVLVTGWIGKDSLHTIMPTYSKYTGKYHNV